MPASKIKVYVAEAMTKATAKEILDTWHDHFDKLCDIHNIRCPHCGVNKMWHDHELKHPFFNNNLEMLEWLAR